MSFPFRELEAAAAAMPDEEAWEWFLKGLPPPVQRRLFEEWGWQAHGGQAEPGGEAWRVWLLMAGRGFGKTLAGAHWVTARARETPGARIALVGATVDEVVKVMIEGRSGLLAVARAADEETVWMPTEGVVKLPRGGEGFVYSAEGGEKLRGPEHHFAWCDELAKWRRGERAWHNLQMGLRLGERPRTMVTTTPRGTALMRQVKGLRGTEETRGRTADNPHSPSAFREWVEDVYGGTRLGRQELDGELIEEAEDALWTRDILERSRAEGALPPMRRIVVGVDPPASEHGNACGIVVCGLGEDDRIYVLADCSVAGRRPEGWARAVAAAAEAWDAARVVAENNQGGDMVESVLWAADSAMPVTMVAASRGKAARAEPVALRFEAGKARLAGRFPELEDELAMLTHAGGYRGAGSPDRADAMVWAMTELMRRPRAQPRIRSL